MNEHQQLVADLAVSGEKLLNRFTPTHCHGSHMLIGLAGEVLELEQALRTAPDFQRSDVIEELGDIEFYLAGLYQCFNIQPPETPNVVPAACGLPQIRYALEHLITRVKRHLYYNQPADPITQALNAFTDILNQFYQERKIHRGKVLAANIAKLRVRYGEKYSDEAAKARRDKF